MPSKKNDTERRLELPYEPVPSYKVLHPFTYMPSLSSESSFYEHYVRLSKGAGSWVFDEHGKQFLYATTAVPSVGLGNPYVLKRVMEQYSSLSFASTCAQGHPLVGALADRLIALSGNPFEMVFFGNDGSGAVETAMRLARQLFMSQGQPKRNKFISLEGNYHGTTFGTGAVTHMGIQEMFGPTLQGCDKSPAPNMYRPPIDGKDSFVIQYCLNMLEETIFENGPESIAAVLLEPIQGVTGIVPMPKEFVTAVREMTRKYGILLIMDEVATGAGRTGAWLASRELGVEADLLTLSKGLTGGYFPMSATLVSGDIASSLFGKGGIFLHGSTQSGHPVGCAAAMAVLDIIESESLIGNARLKGDYILSELNARLQHHPNVGDIRGRGLMLAIEFVSDRHTKEAVDYNFGQKLTSLLHQEGILGNFFNGVLILYPPLNLSQQEADYLVQGTVRAVNELIR
jgi:adenosylmethionine-8-amino-7-oxononanoate aminotransferase